MWQHELVKRAQVIARMSPHSAECIREWNALEDHIMGKLYLWQVEALRAYCKQMSCMGCGVILAMIGE
jgi:hypothetical protein